MTHWNEGYVSDMSYPGGVYRNQMPSHLDAACLVAGVAPSIDPGAPFTYCELGCGVGDTAMVIAAAHPRAQVWGFDFNPAHIAAGAASARRACVGNLVLAERSFRDLNEAAPTDWPMFDYVTAHGVWSWVSPANREHIVAFLAKHLRPGGVFSVSYNAMPGWTESIGLQRFLLEASRQIAEGSEAGMRHALQLARRVVDTGGSALDDRRVSRLEAMLAKGDVGYLSHEYLNEHWAPAFHADVVAALAPAKLSYVAAAELTDNFPHLCVTPEQLAVLEKLPVSMRSSVQDYFCVRRAFRRDVFVKGARRLPARDLEARLRAQTLALIVPFRATTRRVEVSLGTATLNESFYAPAMAMLAERNATVGELLDAAAPGTAPAAAEVAAMLIGTAQVWPVCASPPPDATAHARHVNLARIAEAITRGAQESWLVSPATEVAIRAGLMEMLVFECVACRSHDDVAVDGISAATIRADVVALMSERGMTFNETATEAAQGVDTSAEIETFIGETLPIWRRVGLI